MTGWVLESVSVDSQVSESSRETLTDTFNPSLRLSSPSISIKVIRSGSADFGSKVRSSRATISAFMLRLFDLAASAMRSRMPSGKRTTYFSAVCMTGDGGLFFMFEMVLAFSLFKNDG